MTRYEYAARTIGPHLKNIGSTTLASKQQLVALEARIAAGLLPNSFQFTVHLGETIRLSDPVQTERHLGVSAIDYEAYLDRIHPEWWKLYMIFGISAYAVGDLYAAELARVQASSQIKIPLRVNERGDYVWYNQVSVPAAFDADGNMTAHVNVYQMDRHYDVNYLLTGPLTVFGREVRSEVAHKIQEIAQQIFYREFIDNSPEKRREKRPYLTTGQARVLYLYRSLALNDHQDKVTSEAVAAKSALLWPDDAMTQSSVSSHTRDIRNHFELHAREGTPLNKNNFGTFREMAAFMNSLSGEPVDLLQ